MSKKYTKLESIHCALQELQNEYNIPDDNEHLQIAFKFTEDIREKYLEHTEPLKYTYENKFDYSDEQVNQLREQEKKDNEGGEK